jgi:hypothetical protein
MSQEGKQLLVVLLVILGAAAIGFLIGRLIRGPKPRVEIVRPRIGVSSAYLRDAHNSALSPHTRLRCAFEAIYYCCVELTEAGGAHRDTLEQFNKDVLRAGMLSTNATAEQLQTVELLASWMVDASPELPSVTIKDACRVATHVHSRTVRMLS